jgi:large subunit ribosomal protein L7/L12
MSNLDELVKQLGQLNVIEAGELAKKLEEAWGVTAEMGAVAVAPAGETAPAESSEKTITLKSYPADKKMGLIKLVREILALGLMESKKFVETAPQVIKENVPNAEAEEIIKKFQDAGAELDIK